MMEYSSANMAASRLSCTDSSNMDASQIGVLLFALKIPFCGPSDERLPAPLLTGLCLAWVPGQAGWSQEEGR